MCPFGTQLAKMGWLRSLFLNFRRPWRRHGHISPVGAADHTGHTLAQIVVSGAFATVAATGSDFAFGGAAGHAGPRLAQIVVFGASATLAAPVPLATMRPASPRSSFLRALATLAAPGTDVAFWDTSGHHASGTPLAPYAQTGSDRCLPLTNVAFWQASGHQQLRLGQVGACEALATLAASGVKLAFWDASDHHAPRLAQTPAW